MWNTTKLMDSGTRKKQDGKKPCSNQKGGKVCFCGIKVEWIRSHRKRKQVLVSLLGHMALVLSKPRFLDNGTRVSQLHWSFCVSWQKSDGTQGSSIKWAKANYLGPEIKTRGSFPLFSCMSPIFRVHKMGVLRFDGVPEDPRKEWVPWAEQSGGVSSVCQIYSFSIEQERLWSTPETRLYVLFEIRCGLHIGGSSLKAELAMSPWACFKIYDSFWSVFKEVELPMAQHGLFQHFKVQRHFNIVR